MILIYITCFDTCLNVLFSLYSSLRVAWEGLRQRTVQAGAYHIELGLVLGKLADEVKEFSAEMRNRLTRVSVACSLLVSSVLYSVQAQLLVRVRMVL